MDQADMLSQRSYTERQQRKNRSVILFFQVTETGLQASHLIDYLFDHGVLLDKAWAASKTVKFSTGERRRLVEAVTNENYATITARYKSYCEDIDYKPLGRTSIYEILQNIPLRKTEAVECLDMRIAEGKEAMQSLNRVSNFWLDMV
jgi:hypothetical protein